MAAFSFAMLFSCFDCFGCKRNNPNEEISSQMNGNIHSANDVLNQRPIQWMSPQTSLRPNLSVLNIREDSLIYDMSHSCAQCLIFNHKEFQNPKYKTRKGTEFDCTALEEFFGQRLGYDVTVCEDYTAKQIMDQLMAVAKQDFSDSYGFVCCVLTHGEKDELMAYDVPYKPEVVLSFFTGDFCPTLAGKPKLFIIQACRGNRTDPGVEIQVLSGDRSTRAAVEGGHRDVTDGNGRAKIMKIPIFADFLMAYSSMDGFYSFRDPSSGSWFIQELIRTLENFYQTSDLSSILLETKRRIAYEMISSNDSDKRFDDKKQIPCISDTLTRRVFFRSLRTQSNNSIQ